MMNRVATRAYQKGQASVLGVAFSLMIIAGIYTLYNVSQITTEKTNLVNATDAAAYSSAVHVARNLNYIAYSNRAMMANHIAAGHLTSYWSWIQYSVEVTEIIEELCDTFCNFIPYVGAVIQKYVNIVKELLDVAEDIADTGKELAIGAVNTANLGFIYPSQFSAHLVLFNPTSISKVQETVLTSYHKDIKLQGLGEGLPDYLSSNAKLIAASARVVADQLAISTYLETYATKDDDGVMKQLVELSVDEMANERPDNWMRNGQSRDWQIDTFPVRLTKRGNVSQTQENDGLNWYTEDSFGFEEFKVGLTSSGYETVDGVGNVQANTQQISDNYKGIDQYTSVAEGKDRDECYKASFSGIGFAKGYKCFGVTVVAKRELENAQLEELGEGEHAAGGESLYAVARAEVFFQRPHGLSSLANNKVEFANTFNPFWGARLSE